MSFFTCKIEVYFVHCSLALVLVHLFLERSPAFALFSFVLFFSLSVGIDNRVTLGVVWPYVLVFSYLFYRCSVEHLTGALHAARI